MITRTAPQKIHGQRWKGVWSAFFVVIGGGIACAAFLADRLGYGDAGSFGVGQLLLAVTGLVLLLVGVYGREFPRLYRGVALLFMNTLLLFGCVELGAIVLSRSVQQAKLSGFQELPYYAAQEWTKRYWQEEKLARGYRYKPYVVWKHIPFSGETLNVNQEGIRETPGVECGAAAYKVFTFGGSTMLGWGSPDWGTIAAYLQSGLKTLMTRPVCVLNLGQDGFVSTQSLNALLLQLQSGNLPDAVIFYDGVNEVIAAYESGYPSAHVTLAQIAARFEEHEHPLLHWYKKTRQYAVIHKLVNKLKGEAFETGQEFVNSQGMRVPTRDLAHSVATVYLTNYQIVGALAKEYNFKYFFFLQPHLAICKKALTQEEQPMRSRMDPALRALATAIYGEITSVAPEYENLWSVTNAFDHEDKQIWFDEVGHVTPEGNRLVAHAMLAIIQREL